MKNSGYLIAKNRARDAFFTSSSSYDRPSWVNVKQAKVYASVELAEAAVKKLYAKGAYEARIVEAMAFEMPDGGTENDKKQERQDAMVAIVRGSDGIEIDQGDEDPEMESEVDSALGIADRTAIDTTLDAEQQLDDEEGSDEQVAGGPDGAPIVGESETIPAKPQADAKPSENKDTALDLPKPQKIKYKDPVHTEVEDSKDPILADNDEKVTVQASVLSDLRAAIKEYNDAAEAKKRSQTDDASFCMTVAGAFSELLACLEQGTVRGIKQAQIEMTSWMNPITSLLPVSVQQFVLLGGRKPSLKNWYDVKNANNK